MDKAEKIAWTIGACILLAWCVVFLVWFMTAPYPAVLYP